MTNFSQKISRSTRNGSKLTVDYSEEFIEKIKEATGKKEITQRDIELFIHEVFNGAIQNYAKNDAKTD